MKEQSTSTLSRRNALKKVSLTAGLALAGSGTASANSKASTTVHFVEMGIEHDLTLPDGRDYIYPYVGNDEYREYTIDTERGVLRVKDTARNGVRSVFQKQSHVVKRIGYRPFPAVVYGAQSERWLTTKLDPATLRTTEQLTLAEPYKPPNLSVEASGTTVHLRRSDGDADIHSLEDGVLSLPTQEVAIDVQTIDEEATPKTHVNGEYIPEWKRAVPLTEKRLTITVEPRVKVRNYGRLSIEV